MTRPHPSGNAIIERRNQSTAPSTLIFTKWIGRIKKITKAVYTCIFLERKVSTFSLTHRFPSKSISFSSLSAHHIVLPIISTTPAIVQNLYNAPKCHTVNTKDALVMVEADNDLRLEVFVIPSVIFRGVLNVNDTAHNKSGVGLSSFYQVVQVWGI